MTFSRVLSTVLAITLIVTSQSVATFAAVDADSDINKISDEVKTTSNNCISGNDTGNISEDCVDNTSESGELQGVVADVIVNSEEPKTTISNNSISANSVVSANVMVEPNGEGSVVINEKLYYTSYSTSNYATDRTSYICDGCKVQIDINWKDTPRFHSTYGTNNYIRFQLWPSGQTIVTQSKNVYYENGCNISTSISLESETDGLYNLIMYPANECGVDNVFIYKYDGNVYVGNGISIEETTNYQTLCNKVNNTTPDYLLSQYKQSSDYLYTYADIGTIATSVVTSNIVSGKVTNYDKARAIYEYVGTNFSSQSSTYKQCIMITMLATIDIPSIKIAGSYYDWIFFYADGKWHLVSPYMATMGNNVGYFDTNMQKAVWDLGCETVGITEYVPISGKIKDTVAIDYKGKYCRDDAYAVLGLVNDYRTQNGLTMLTMDSQLIDAAELRACETSLYYGHIRPNGKSCYSTGATGYISAENITAGQETAAEVMDSWINSEGHRKNILRESSSQIGIGCYEHNGVKYWTQLFGESTTKTATRHEDEEKTTTIYSLEKNISPMFIESSISVNEEETAYNQLELNNLGSSYFKSIPQNGCITYITSDESVATVNAEGIVTGVCAGNATISAKIGNKGTSYTVGVKAVPKPQITLSRTRMVMDDEDTCCIAATVSHSTDSNPVVEWASSAEDVATVDSKGVVTAHKKGIAIITATLASRKTISSDCEIEVISNKYTISNVSGLESLHPYASNSNDIYYYTVNDAEELFVTFSDDTFVEDKIDYIKVYSGNGYLVGRFTGYELAGRTVNVTGDTVRIRIESNASIEGYGFKVMQITTEMPDDEEEAIGNGDVIADDVPAGGIPKGLWMAGLSGAYDYTGKAIKPKVRIYNYKTLLIENKDYTITYKNNVNAYTLSDGNIGYRETHAPIVIIKGKGNYKGNIKKSFICNPIDMEKAVSANKLTVANHTLVTNGKIQKAIPIIKYNGKSLKNKIDFDVTYSANENYKEAGVYNIFVKGRGNYSGEITVKETIVDSHAITLIGKTSIEKIPNQMYTGGKITPTLTVKHGKTQLQPGVDYSIEYSNNVDIGKAIVVVTGIGNYAGQKSTTFKITGFNLNKVKIDNWTPYETYTGSEIEISNYILTYMPNKEAVPVQLNKGIDYSVSYQKNVNVGTATVLFTGMGKYSGVVKKTFKIVKYDIQADTQRKMVVTVDSITGYRKGNVKPEPVVMFDGSKLVKGRDYIVTYTNNKKVALSTDRKAPTVIIRGKGNYKNSISYKYSIRAKDLSSIPKENIAAKDKIYEKKRNVYKTSLSIKDIDMKLLKAGKDYSKNCVYTYTDTTVLVNGAIRKTGDIVEASDVIPAGTMITLQTNGIGNYCGTLITTYRIAQASITKVKSNIENQKYTGKAIKPKKKDIVLTIGKKKLTSADYDIISYSNNIKKGTATILIRGKNNYGGYKKITFRIVSQNMKWWEYVL